MTRSTHVGIFITDYSEFCANTHGTFGELSANLLKKSGLKDEIKFYDIIKSQFPTDDELKDIKAIWITGSRGDSFSDEAWILNLNNYIKETLLPQGIPLIGICFGHQIIARALGSKVGRSDKGWELGVELIDVSKDPEVLDLLKVFEDGEFVILESHQDIVFETPKGYKNIGSSKRTESQGFYKKGKVLTFQGHPEFTKGLVEDILKNKLNDGKITQDIYENSLKALDEFKDDGPTIGKIIVNFIQSL